MTAIHPLLKLAQRFTIDWLDLADPAVPPTIMTDDYTVHIGDVELVGLPAYSAATLGQLQSFPGLMLTVHDVISDGQRLAMAFTEHGAALKNSAAVAWTGVALFTWDGAKLTENWTQEDYYARRRQLAEQRPDVVAAPATAPWTTQPLAGSPGVEDVVRDWLLAPSFDGVSLDDGLHSELVIDVAAIEVTVMFAAGDQVGFAATWSGPYRAGLDGVDGSVGKQASLGCAGLVTVAGGRVSGGRVVTDRMGLRRALLPPR